MTAQSPNRTGLFGLLVTGRLTPTVEFTGRLTGPVRLRTSLPHFPHDFPSPIPGIVLFQV